MKNQETKHIYTHRSAVRIDFFRRILEFGYVMYFYMYPISLWIEEPLVTKGRWTDKKKEKKGDCQSTDYRESSEEVAQWRVR